MDHLSKYTAEQRLIIEEPDVSLNRLILSAAGTGKSEVLVESVLRLIHIHEVEPSSILCSSFTQTAGNNMWTRLCQRDERSKGILYCDTWHSNARSVLSHYHEIDDEHELYDVDEILLQFLVFLRSTTNHSIEFRQSIRYVFTDEYQDTNELQDAILYELYKSGAKINAFGDDLQAVMGFQGSDIRFIRSYKERFEPCKLYTLSINFRCSDPILQLSHGVTQQGRTHEYIPKPMPISIERHLFNIAVNNPNYPTQNTQFVSKFPKPRLLHCRHNFEAIQQTVNEIKELLTKQNPYHPSGENWKAHDFGIIGRNSFVLQQVHAMLKSCNINSIFWKYANRLHKFEERQGNQDSTIEKICQNHVKLFTIHDSKGESVPNAYILVLHRQFFPDAREPDVDKERNLLNVAITRAVQRLTLWNCYPETSLFIHELHEKGLLTQLTNTTMTEFHRHQSISTTSSAQSENNMMMKKMMMDIGQTQEERENEKKEEEEEKEEEEDDLETLCAQVDSWISSLNGSSYREIRTTMLPAPLPIEFEKICDDDDDDDNDNSKPFHHSLYVMKHAIQESMKDFLDAWCWRYIQQLKINSVSDRNNHSMKEYVFEPAACESNPSANQFQQSSSRTLPKEYIGRIKYAYREYQNMNQSWQKVVSNIYWTATASSLRLGRTAMMHTAVGPATFGHYNTLLQEIEQVLPQLIDVSKSDWDYYSLHPLRNNPQSLDAFIIAQDRFIIWYNEADSFGSFPIDIVMKALAYVALFSLRTNVRINTIQVYHTFSRKICTIDISEWCTHEEFINFIRKNKRHIYTL